MGLKTGTKQNYIWEEDFVIRTYDLDREGKATFQAISDFIMETAFNHSYQLSLSVLHLRERNLTWVLSRLHIQLDEYPKWKDRITIKTWPAKIEEFFTIRDFHILDKGGRVIGRATTSAMMMDLNTRKPIPMPDFMQTIQLPENGRAIEDPFEKLPTVSAPDFEKSFHVRLSDLDINQHVNFVNYLEWSIETVPVHVWQEYRLYDLQISYRAESRYGDLITSHSELLQNSGEKVFVHSLRREEGQKELSRLVTKWKPQRK